MCGIFGIWSERNCLPYLAGFKGGVFHLQHRGQEYCGFAIFNGEKIVQPKLGKGLLRENFKKEGLKRIKGNFGIAHTSLGDPQPYFLSSRWGDFAVAYDGNVINADELREELKNKGFAFSSNWDVEIIAHLIGSEKGITEGIEKVFGKVRGAFSILVLTREGVWVIRDSRGIRPLVIGQSKRRKMFVASSESCPFEYLNVELVRDVKAGEVILINQDGIKTKMSFPSPRVAHCAFEWVYLSQPASIIGGISAEILRNELGLMLGKGYKLHVDLIGAIEDTGRGVTEGLAEASGIPHKRVFQRYPFAHRSFTLKDAVRRELEADLKLIPIGVKVKGKRVGLGDDSRVRGTQAKKLANRLRRVGAKKVVVVFSCPSLIAHCLYSKSTRKGELIAVGRTEEEIKKIMRLDECILPTVEEFVSVFEKMGLKAKDLCLACWTGKYPVQ